MIVARRSFVFKFNIRKFKGMEIFFERVNDGMKGEIPPPAYATKGSSGMDLRAAISDPTGYVVIPSGCRVTIPTGFRVSIPEGYEGQIRPRSGLAMRAGITVLNTPGTIDQDYTGEIQVILINHSPVNYVVYRFDRIAQLVITPVARATNITVATESDRGANGFGSTGID